MRPSAPEIETGPPLTVPDALLGSRPPATVEPLRPLVSPEEETARSMVAPDEAPIDEAGRELRSAVYDRTKGTTSTVQVLRTSGAWNTPGRKSDPGR